MGIVEHSFSGIQGSPSYGYVPRSEQGVDVCPSEVDKANFHKVSFAFLRLYVSKKGNSRQLNIFDTFYMLRN